MLRIAQNDLGDADAIHGAHGLAEQCVRVIAGLARNDVVRRFEKSIVDIRGCHKVHDVYAVGLLDGRGAKVLLGEDHEMPLRVLVALDQVGPGHGQALALAHALELDGRPVGGMQHAEAGPVITNGDVQFDRNIDETKRKRSLPDRSSHDAEACTRCARRAEPLWHAWSDRITRAAGQEPDWLGEDPGWVPGAARVVAKAQDRAWADAEKPESQWSSRAD